MNVTEVLSHYFHPGSIHKQPVPEEGPIRLLPRMPLDELPPYREHLAILAGWRVGGAHSIQSGRMPQETRERVGKLTSQATRIVMPVPTRPA